ncbi:MAG: hypothetical protein WD069_05045 [Planctomycetales bacterium]
MADDSEPKQQHRYRQFVDLLPLTLAIAGLPPSDPGKYFSEEQIETRLFTLRHAWRGARQFAKECVRGPGSSGEAG